MNRNELTMENYIMLNGKRVDLTDEQIESLALRLMINLITLKEEVHTSILVT